MGLIRKTVSVGTLGLVSFRSKKEKLRRAEFSQHDAEAALEREHEARLEAEVRSIAAEKREKHAMADAARAKRKSDKRRGRRRHKSDRLAGLVAGAEPIVRSGMESAVHAGHDAAERGRKVGRRARKAAKRSAIDAKKAAERGRKVGRRARKAAKRSAIEARKTAAIDAKKAAERGRKIGRRARKAAKQSAVDAIQAAERTVHQAAEAVSASK